MYQQPPQEPNDQPQHTHYPQQPYQQTGPGVPPPPQYYPTGGLPPQYPMPPQQPPRQPGFFSRRAGCLPVWGWLLLAVLAIGAIGSAARGNNTPATNTPAAQTTTQANTPDTQDTQPQPTDTPAPTPTPTKAPKWVTTHSYTGHGNKKTGVISVPDDWKINWSCQGFTDGTGIDGSMYVTVHNSDGTVFDYSAVNTDCKAGGWTSDNTEEHQAGDIYFDVTATGQWKIQVEEFK
ncbi:MAG: hypothetical protein ACJ788_10095 [Ktedonobacteraceae bacterium]